MKGGVFWVPKLSQLWDFEAALRCLKAVDDVLDYFFADLCELSPEESQMFLISAITEGTDTKLAVPVEHLEILKTAREKWKLQFRFLNLDNPVENVIDQKYKRKR